MTAPTSLTLTNDPDLGIVVIRDGDDGLGEQYSYQMSSDDQPLNRQSKNTGATKFAWDDTLYAGTVHLHLDYVDPDDPEGGASLDAELVLDVDVNPHFLTGEWAPEPPPVEPPARSDDDYVEPKNTKAKAKSK